MHREPPKMQKWLQKWLQKYLRSIGLRADTKAGTPGVVLELIKDLKGILLPVLHYNQCNDTQLSWAQISEPLFPLSVICTDCFDSDALSLLYSLLKRSIIVWAFILLS
jgi:hypothetical protein